MKLNHITIVVTDRAKAVEFYSETLGLEIVEKGKSVWMKIDDQYIHLAQNSGQPVKNNFYHFCISVGSITLYVKKLIAAGVDVFDLNGNMEREDINQNLDKEHRQFFINDPDGNLIELVDIDNEYFK